ncbi:YnhF family membrane protein [Mixta tenebrionis]|uniref:YnhF family membrane protein n=1 Tax=Mixta tenebrionis TaxID=2562439 RepID=A0A506VFY3_9GAMM|nr:MULTISPECIES: YnhF family membrane protein [Mixta]TPW44229.1 YnhF family membrane protein [Mixta tenebrionis]
MTDVAQRKAGILSSRRKENEIFTGECGKIYPSFFVWLIREGGLSTDFKLALCTAAAALSLILAFSLTAATH